MLMFRALLALLAGFLLFGCVKDRPTDLRALLLDKDFGALESRLRELQDRYARGDLTDLQLRAQYRAFDRMERGHQSALDQWVKHSPQSYFAHVVRGYHSRSQAFWIRGTGWARDQSAEQWAQVQSYLKAAEQDMKASLALDPAPVLSYYVLIDTAGLPCERPALNEYFSQAAAHIPRSKLLFNRQLHYLKPRWCGSNNEMEQFVTQAGSSGMSVEGIAQLRAIVEDDLGRSLLDAKSEERGVEHLAKGAELGQPFGPEFRRESLFALDEFACKLPRLKRYCATS